MPPRVSEILPPGNEAKDAFDTIRLDHDQRRLRRKVLRLSGGSEILLDLPQTVSLEHESLLRLEDGRLVQVIAAQIVVAVQNAQLHHSIRRAKREWERTFDAIGDGRHGRGGPP